MEIETEVVVSPQGMRGVYTWREESSFTVGVNCIISTKKQTDILIEETKIQTVKFKLGFSQQEVKET